MLGRQISVEWGAEELKGVREKSMTLNGEPVNITSDDNEGWQELLNEAGENSVEVSVSGVSKDGVLRKDWFAKTRTKALKISYPNGDEMTGQFVLASYSDTGPYQDAATFEATFQSTGTPTYTPAPPPGG